MSGPAVVAGKRDGERRRFALLLALLALVGLTALATFVVMLLA